MGATGVTAAPGEQQIPAEDEEREHQVDKRDRQKERQLALDAKGARGEE